MATKSYKLRLDLRDREPLADANRFKDRKEEIQTVGRWLDDTREAFNTGVDYLTGWLLRMHRGAGVCREKKDGVWRDWKEIHTLDELEEARQRHKSDPVAFDVLENQPLLDVFKGKGISEDKAVQLAECCRRIIEEIAPAAGEDELTQMNRSDLDLLTLADSEARGVRPKSAAKDGSDKKTSGKRPGWMLDKAIYDGCGCSSSLDDLIERLKAGEEFRSAKKDGEKKIEALRKKHCNSTWPVAKSAILAPHKDGRAKWKVAKKKWEDKRRASEESGAVSAYKKMLEAGCLPLPGLSRPNVHLKLNGHLAEWNYAMWNMAGQRVRSHLGWSRRRANERTLWELRTALFDRGGWIRIKRNGKKLSKNKLEEDVSKGELKSEELIRFDAHPDQTGDFEMRPAYAGREWVKALGEYEIVEMPKHLEGGAFGAADPPRILKKTVKGWGVVRDKWTDLFKKVRNTGKDAPSARDLLETFDQMRARKTRDFGDRRLFEWLAAPQRRWLWDGSDRKENNNCGRADRDCVSAFITHNEHLSDKPDSITFTRSSAVKHPVWPSFGENSAVGYRLARGTSADGTTRLILVLRQLLSKQSDGSYTAINDVRISLRGYEDFEKSFVFPSGRVEVSAKQALSFRDDLLGEKMREGTLSGIKLTWERDELESHRRKRHPRKAVPRIYANFSCDAGDTRLPEWLADHVGSNVKLKKPRDGMTSVFWLKKAIRKDSPDEDGASVLPPGERSWPKAAVENGFTIRGTDLGYRTSSAGAWWRLSFEKPQGKVVWSVGMCEGITVYAVHERTGSVSLPGDGESLPPAEQALRERLYSLRTRLNLNNALLRIVRLLTLNDFLQRKSDGDKQRKRKDGTIKRIGTKWKTETVTLDEPEIKENCRKAAEQLFLWGSSDAISESLKASGFDGPVWNWLAANDPQLGRLAGVCPKTQVPTEKQAKRERINRNALKTQREKEEADFAQAVFELRIPLARALCDGYAADRRKRAGSGMWANFDRALIREISYSDRGRTGGIRERFDNGLFRLLRRPSVTKHLDRKDEANNLPRGQTHRGGLSMNRLNFLDDVKNFVRRWSCRPRWPGDIRRVPENAKFDRCDTEHLDHLREHRAKLIAHADIAQTLGFEQDLRRGLWLYQKADRRQDEVWHRPERGHLYQWRDSGLVQTGDNAPSRPKPAYSPAHILVYEDLTRYKMSSDRPKNENAGLARWSHRSILSFAQHIGTLFGVPVATVDARFSSRYCSQCGAPGCRAARFDPSWLQRAWLRKVIESNDIRDAAMKSIAKKAIEEIGKNPHVYDRMEDRPWVLRDGGEHFVCANKNCIAHKGPTNADHNAAANIGLRFLRGVDGVRVTINGNGTILSSIGYVLPGIKLTQANPNHSGEPYWQVSSVKSKPTRNNKPTPGDKATEAVLADEEDDAGGVLTLFQDPSGTVRSRDHWFEGKVFWGAVARSCADGIHATNASRFGSDDDETED